MESGFEAVSPGVATGEFELVLGVLVLVENFVEGGAGDDGHFVFELAEAVGEIVEVGEGEFGFVDDGIGGIEFGVLGEVTDFDGFGDGAGTGVEGEFVGEDFEDGSFAAAVVADETDALAAVDGEEELVEEDAASVVFFEVGECGDGHGIGYTVAVRERSSMSRMRASARGKSADRATRAADRAEVRSGGVCFRRARALQ